jgi:hypothetical protein
MRSVTVLLLVAAVAAGTWMAPAGAGQRPQRHSHSVLRPLTVPKRSYLDAGVVVAPGSMPNYATTTIMESPAYSYDDRFTRNLPSPWFMPGRPQPIFQFETPGR